MGVATLAVFSDADENALFVRLADEAVNIGLPPASDSYLNIEKIIETALQHEADAVHPGYGFLSENAAFARAVEAAGLTFIGPPPSAIDAMGDKAQARALMIRSGVPVVPGWQGEDDDAGLVNAAVEIGFPVIVKAAAGGGGKGMRIASTVDDLPDALESARREALHAFGDQRLIIEKYLPDARHVEFQVIADQHGETIHLNDRECSVQRRHQKIIEEAPSPLMTSDLRLAMGKTAVDAAKAVGYSNAGTVEFIVDPKSKAYYFLEMNTRLQVEHPITELTTGVDLVQMQIQIAAGAPLPKSIRNGLQPRGHAIEARLYAEDPAAGFLPAAGPLLTFIPPDGPGIRVDTGVTSGDEISTYYDPMIAKIIVHGPDRPTAIRRLQTALRDTVVLGVRSNLLFLQAVLSHPVFEAGEATTRFVENHLSGWQPDSAVPVEVLIAAALSKDQREKSGRTEKSPSSPWLTLSGFRTGSE
jgi:acetyl/propionyl-CoA carboxylase alpha subunit